MENKKFVKIEKEPYFKLFHSIEKLEKEYEKKDFKIWEQNYQEYFLIIYQEIKKIDSRISYDSFTKMVFNSTIKEWDYEINKKIKPLF